MTGFKHERHKSPTPLKQPRELVLACPPFRSQVNLSRIVRAAGCCGVQHIVCAGNGKVKSKIARDGAEAVEIDVHRSLEPQLKKLKQTGYALVGLEQTSGSVSLFEFPFTRKTVLVLGNERLGISENVLALLDATVEIPVYGLPHSHNVATATAMALYEYCRQFPDG